jgi:hypothetical protein
MQLDAVRRDTVLADAGAMGLTALLIIPALRRSGFERWVRLACIAHVLATVLAGIVDSYSTYLTNC